MNLIGKYQNGNYTVSLYDDGTKVRENDLDFFDAAFPESMDIKITNRCNMNCPMCHEDSKCDGAHGDIMSESFIDRLHPYTELACLSGDTVVHSENGAVDIKDLKIGDRIYDSEYKLRTVIDIKTSNKDCYEIHGARGLKIICSEDHPFIVDSNQVIAKDLIGKPIDTINLADNKQEEYIVDMSKHILAADPNKKGSRGGKVLDDGRILLRHNTAPIPRYIHLTNELMWVYGLYVAEGDKRSYTLNINEKEFAQTVGKTWVNTFNSSYYTIIEHPEHNSLNLLLSPQTLMQELFVNEMKAGKGARNKNLSYLYHIQNKELVRWALIGLIDGDGCFRKRKGKRTNNMYSASLKTTSKKLAYDFAYLLMKWFNIKTSIYHGISPERKIEGRILTSSDYYMVDFYGYEYCKRLFGDYYGELIPTLEDSRRVQDNISSINKVDNEILYDITLDSGTHIFPINGYWLTHNCGGGNVLEHPDFYDFLVKCKNLKLICNTTIRQEHFMQNIDFIRKLRDEGLIYGLGISLSDPWQDGFIDAMKEFPNAVIHVINGIVTMQDLEQLRYYGLKILILGYKEFRRGEKLYENADAKERIDGLKRDIYNYLPEIVDHGWFDVVSFDNLAIKQLNPQRMMSKEAWDEMYMGDDGLDGEMTSASMYVDMVKREFARNSCAVDRYPIMDDIKDMFNFLRGRNGLD